MTWRLGSSVLSQCPGCGLRLSPIRGPPGLCWRPLTKPMPSPGFCAVFQPLLPTNPLGRASLATFPRPPPACKCPPGPPQKPGEAPTCQDLVLPSPQSYVSATSETANREGWSGLAGELAHLDESAGQRRKPSARPLHLNSSNGHLGDHWGAWSTWACASNSPMGLPKVSRPQEMARIPPQRLVTSTRGQKGPQQDRKARRRMGTRPPNPGDQGRA